MIRVVIFSRIFMGNWVVMDSRVVMVNKVVMGSSFLLVIYFKLDFIVKF